MKFSVLINNYNYARFLPETLASVLAQTHPPHEIIVVDDGSTDDSLAVLESLRATTPGLRIHAKPNGGQLSAFRQGIDLAAGDWCAFLDADDTWEPGHLATADRALAVSPETGVYYSGHRETSGPPMYRSKWPEGPGGPFAALVAATGVRIGTITSTLILSRPVAVRVAQLSASLEPDWRIRADDVLLFAAALDGAVFYHDPTQTVRYRIHGGNSYVHGAHSDKEALYRAALDRLFTRIRGDKNPPSLFDELRAELAALPPPRRSHEALRRYRRALWRQKAPLISRLRAMLGTRS